MSTMGALPCDVGQLATASELRERRRDRLSPAEEFAHGPAASNVYNVCWISAEVVGEALDHPARERSTVFPMRSFTTWCDRSTPGTGGSKSSPGMFKQCSIASRTATKFELL
jgi:hypothetical protein